MSPAATTRVTTLRQALAARRDVVIAQHERHLNPRMMKVYEFIGLDNLPVRALGSYFWDSNGTRYVDFLSAFGTLAYGHNHERLLAALQEVQDARLPNLVEGPSALAGALAENLSILVGNGLKRVYFANSGTEAVDAAIKMARAATGRPAMISCRGAYHGRSIGALSLSDRREYRENFEPLLPEVHFVDFNDAPALEVRLMRRDVAGFIVEPLQGEAGMIVPAPGYLKEVRRLCSRYGTVLIFDEIQAGLGRTGRFLASDHDGVVPDCLLLGKALGGGVMPLSALLTTDALYLESKGDAPQSPFHVSTYAGNTYACAVGLASLELLTEEGLVQRAADSGEYLFARLKSLQSRQTLIADVRGRGLMIGLELAPPAIFRTFTNGAFGKKLQASDIRYLLSAMVLRHLIGVHRVVTAITLNNSDVIRIQPPLNVERDVIDHFVDSLETTLAYVSNYARSALRSTPDILRFLRSKPVAASSYE